MLSTIGLIFSLSLLIVLTIRGMNLLIAAPVCALIVAITGNLDLIPAEGVSVDYVSSYMAGFSAVIQSWFFMFLLGSIFGKLMEDSGAAESVARWIIGRLGSKYAAFATVIACAVLTYGGVSLFVVAFTAFPIALGLFKQANLPRRFIPATLAFGSVTFTMTSAGSPEIQNWIPIEFLGTSPYAEWEVSLVVAIFMALFGFWWLRRMLNKAVAAGEQFEVRDTDPPEISRNLPNPILSLIPLAIVLGTTFFLHNDYGSAALIVALLAGCLATWAINVRFLPSPGMALSAGSIGALIAIGNTAAVVGFGSVAKVSPAFDMAVQFVTSIPGNELIGAAIAVSIIAALTGSASGGQSIALPVLAPQYLELGVDPEALHRVVAISSGALDSLPHNGYVVTTIRAICGETHRDAYAPLGALTVVIPVIGTVLAICLLLVF